MSRLILAVVTLTLCACLGMTRLAVASGWQALPTPTTGAGHAPVRLRVVHAFNPRFPMLSHAQVEAILKSAARLAEEHLSLRVQFDTHRRSVTCSPGFQRHRACGWSANVFGDGMTMRV